MSTRIRTAAALAGAVALALPGAALAAPGHGHGHGHPNANGRGHAEQHAAKGKRALTFTGTVASVDATGGMLTVTVTGGNHAARSYAGHTRRSRSPRPRASWRPTRTATAPRTS